MDEKSGLIQRAIDAAKQAYIPYSNYLVGAALLTKSGNIYSGCNIENSSFSMTSCAERNAIFKAVTEGEREWRMIVVATVNGVFPCGACRQVMYEFNPELTVIVANFRGEIIREISVSDLLPYAFGPKNLIMEHKS